MIAATFVANLVYTMDALHNYAMAVYYCPQEIRTIWKTMETAAASEVNALRATCADVCRRNTFSQSYMNSYSIGSGREAWGNAYYCMCRYRSTYARTTARPVYRSCGTLYSCSDSLNPYVTAEVNTIAWAGYVVATGGLRRTILDVECCPGAGTVGGQVAAHLGMGGSNVRGAASVYAHATPNNVGITGCYVQAQDTFYDPSGTWVYDSDCPYNP